MAVSTLMEHLPEGVVARYETLAAEGLKDVAHETLHYLGRTSLGREIITRYATGGGPRIEDEALHTEVGGIELENAVMVGAGWDKTGSAIVGLHALGFAGVEIGTVPIFPQAGNPKPRLWTIDDDHSVAINRLGFNSPGMEAVARNLEKIGKLPCPVGISVGKNKLMPDEQAPWAHAEVAKGLYPWASYFAVNVSSPNTPGLRGLQAKGPLRSICLATQEAMEEEGGQKPLWVKVSPDLTSAELDDVVGVALDLGLSGLIAANTTIREDLKYKYGQRWAKEAGGLSGNDPEFKSMSTIMLYLIHEANLKAEGQLEIIGVGGVRSAQDAIEKMLAGASAVQVVTAIREQRGRTAAIINQGILDWMKEHKVENIKHIIGAGTPHSRYPKRPVV